LQLPASLRAAKSTSIDQDEHDVEAEPKHNSLTY
jgi:hypothetical protein